MPFAGDLVTDGFEIGVNPLGITASATRGISPESDRVKGVPFAVDSGSGEQQQLIH